MKRYSFFMIMALSAIGSIVVALTPQTFGLQAEPDYGLAALGLGVLMLVFGIMFALIVVDRKDEAAVELSAFINFELCDEARARLAEEDLRYEQNSGIKRLK